MENYNNLIIEETTEEIIEAIPEINLNAIEIIKNTFSEIFDKMDGAIFSVNGIEFSLFELFAYSIFFVIGMRIVISILWEHE